MHGLRSHSNGSIPGLRPAGHASPARRHGPNARQKLLRHKRQKDARNGDDKQKAADDGDEDLAPPASSGPRTGTPCLDAQPSSALRAAVRVGHAQLATIPAVPYRQPRMPAANAAAASPPAVNASARGISVAIRRMHATIAEKATEAAEARADADALVTEVAELRRLLARANARLAGAGLRQVQLDDEDDREEGEGLEGKIHRVNPDFGSTLTASSMDSQSKCWVNWKIMGQPCEFQVMGKPVRKLCSEPELRVSNLRILKIASCGAW